MTGGRKRQPKRTRRWRVVAHAVRREQVDVRKLGRALIALAQAKAEAEAQAAHVAQKRAGEADQ